MIWLFLRYLVDNSKEKVLLEEALVLQRFAMTQVQPILQNILPMNLTLAFPKIMKGVLALCSHVHTFV